jgi:membrane-associated HD superfamily phosphohydrolase
MRSATAEQLGQLIESIVNDRIAQRQLNQAPLTLEDVAKVKSSFTFTLLNVLHSRVGYAPTGDPGAGSAGEPKPS